MTSTKPNELEDSTFSSLVSRSGGLLAIRPIRSVARGAGGQLDAMSYRFLFRVLAARQAVNVLRAGLANEHA